MKLSRFVKVPLREIWKHEARDFTGWLVKDEGLELLSEAIEITLANPRTEVAVGKFSIDVLVDDIDNSREVIIENQLKKTDHDHLGKLITYASGINAGICIWIVARVQEEHEQAINWLNENTSDKVNFFLMEVEVYRIGDSPPAPKFNIVAKPNNWAKTIKQRDTKDSNLKLQQKSFWERVREYGEENCRSISSWQSPRPQNWYDLSIGSRVAILRVTINSQKNFIGLDFYIHRDKELFHQLKTKRDQIESQLGYELDWQELPDKKASKMGITKECDFQLDDEQDALVEWVVKKIEEFNEVFKDLI